MPAIFLDKTASQFFEDGEIHIVSEPEEELKNECYTMVISEKKFAIATATFAELEGYIPVIYITGNMVYTKGSGEIYESLFLNL